MGSGTTYEQKGKDGKPSARKFYECRKCHDRVYTKEISFQEYLNKCLKKE